MYLFFLHCSFSSGGWCCWPWWDCCLWNYAWPRTSYAGSRWMLAAIKRRRRRRRRRSSDDFALPFQPLFPYVDDRGRSNNKNAYSIHKVRLGHIGHYRFLLFYFAKREEWYKQRQGETSRQKNLFVEGNKKGWKKVGLKAAVGSHYHHDRLLVPFLLVLFSDFPLSCSTSCIVPSLLPFILLALVGWVGKKPTTWSSCHRQWCFDSCSILFTECYIASTPLYLQHDTKVHWYYSTGTGTSEVLAMSFFGKREGEEEEEYKKHCPLTTKTDRTDTKALTGHAARKAKNERTIKEYQRRFTEEEEEERWGRMKPKWSKQPALTWGSSSLVLLLQSLSMIFVLSFVCGFYCVCVTVAVTLPFPFVVTICCFSWCSWGEEGSARSSIFRRTNYFELVFEKRNDEREAKQWSNATLMARRHTTMMRTPFVFVGSGRCFFVRPAVFEAAFSTMYLW